MPQRPAAPPPWASRIPRPADRLPAEMEAWLEAQRVHRNRPASTLRCYHSDLAKLAAFLGKRPVSSLDRRSLHDFMSELAAVVPNPRSRARVLSSVRTWMRWCVGEEILPGYLVERVVSPTFATGDPRPIPPESVRALLACLPVHTLMDLRDRALVHLLLSTGCRISEAISIDRDQPGPQGFRVLGKGRRRRTVYLTAEALSAVLDWIEARGPDPSPALFVSLSWRNLRDGRPKPDNRLTEDGARVALRGLQRRMAGTPGGDLIALLTTPHVARHTVATALLEATDGDMRLVQEVLGHSRPDTLRVYAEVRDQRKLAAYLRLSAYLAESGRGGDAPLVRVVE